MTKLWRRWDRNTHTDRRSSRWVHPNRRDGNGRSKPAKEHEHENGLRPLRRDGRNLDGRHVHPDVPSDLSARACRIRSEEHTSELQSLMRISYAVFCLKKKRNRKRYNTKSRDTH